jgi:hypothetical protein
VTIQDLGSIGELVAAIATVVTLIYLAVQIRANTIAIKAEGRRSNLAAGTPIRIALAQDRELARLFNTGLSDFEKLDAEDKTRFAFLLGDFLATAAAAHNEVKLGITTEVEFAEQADIIGPFLRAPGGRAFWDRFGARYPEPFREWVAREILRDNLS